MIVREVDAAGFSVAVTFEVRDGRVPAGAVSVVGDFNGWDPLADPLTRHGDGWCRTTVVMPPGRYRFRYLAESDHWFDEESADAYEPNRHGGYDSVLVLDLSGIDETHRPEEQPRASEEAPVGASRKPARKPREKLAEAATAKPSRKAKAPAEEAPEKPSRRTKTEPAHDPAKPVRKAKKESAETPSKPARRTKAKPADPTD